MQDLSQQIAAGKFDAVEEVWLAKAAERPFDIAFFTQTARALNSAGEGDLAEVLVQMLDDQLRQTGAWRERLAVLRQFGGSLIPEPLKLHAAIVKSLSSEHQGSELFTKLADKTGLHRAPEDTRKAWEKVERLEELMALAPGTVVLMEGKGPGRVTEVNLQLDSFRVDLAGIGTLSVGFAAAKKMLRPLPPDHLLRRRLEEPAALAELKASRPEELVRLALATANEPLTGNELRQVLTGIVSEAEWTSFWNRARKSPHVVALPGTRQRYRWAESADAAVAGVREGFMAAGLKERLDLLRSHGDRDPALKREMLAALADQGEVLRASDPAAAFEVAIALERNKVEAAGKLTPETILGAVDDPIRLLATLGDRGLREEGYKRLVTLREDWPTLFEKAILREEDARALDLLADRLTAAAQTAWDRLVSELLTQPRKNPAGFTWLAERAAGEEALLRRNPVRLFQQILTAAADPSFSAHKKRLLKLADSGGTLPRLLPHLESGQAAQIEEAVGKAPGLEEYQREALRNAVLLRFPELRQSAEQPLYATPEMITAKREELRQLLEVEIPANRKAIQEARELGDLRENFEYKSARQRHEYLSARATSLNRDLGRARPIDASKVEAVSVRVGTKLHLVGKGGEERWLTILGPWDSHPEQGILSNESDLAGALLGKEPGDDVTVEGKGYKIAEILPFR